MVVVVVVAAVVVVVEKHIAFMPTFCGAAGPPAAAASALSCARAAFFDSFVRGRALLPSSPRAPRPGPAIAEAPAAPAKRAATDGASGGDAPEPADEAFPDPPLPPDPPPTTIAGTFAGDSPDSGTEEFKASTHVLEWDWGGGPVGAAGLQSSARSAAE